MKFDTRFSIGDKIYIVHTERRPTVIPCPKCNGERVKTIDGFKHICIFCEARPYVKFADGSPTEVWNEKSTILIPYRHNWDHSTPAKNTHEVGKIIIDFTGEGYDRYNKKEEKGRAIIKYMCVETGVGSGTLWKESDCFPSEVEALAECDRRNAAAAHSS